MKYIILLLFIISKICSQEDPDYSIIEDIYKILIEKKEYKINKEITLLSIPFLIISSNNIKAKLTGESEFDFMINNKTFENKTEYSFTFNDFIQTSIINEEEGVVIITLNISEPENKNIILSIDCLTLPYDSLFYKVEKEYCEDVKKNIKELIERAYIYLDYAKNPKQPEGFPNYFEKVDFIKDLNDIKTEDTTFYEFYRDIRGALGKFKDMHLNIASQVTQNGIDLEKSVAVIPFSFSIRKNENNETKLYIDPIIELVKIFFQDYIPQIEKVINTPLKSINEGDPFDYIQNFIGNKFFQTKNRHATFSNNINGNLPGAIPLIYYPLTKEELTDIKFIFENDEELTLSFYFILFKDDSFTEEFNNFFKETMDYNKAKLVFPNIFEIEKKFLKKKNIIQKNYNQKKLKILENINLKDGDEKDEEKVVLWNFTFIDNDNVPKFKCHVNDEEKVNVFVQIDFMFNDIDNALDAIINCSTLFHSNDYPIIAIQARNPGGLAAFGFILMEALQAHIDSTEYISYKPDEIIYKDFFSHSYIDTCEIADPIKDNQTITDEYGDNIIHERTPIYNYFNKPLKEIFSIYRKKICSKNHNKKPTEIIVFTDGFSFSTTSLFIKGLQKEGGAIIVGYLGNPNLPAEEFDGSQAPSIVQQFQDTEYAKNLNNSGFIINGITVGETFLNPYEKNQIPREYQFNPVDERADIYETYTDNAYDKFISEGKKIFEKYKTNCNPKNKNLTLFHNDCYNINNTAYLHGGKICNEDGTWSDKCAPVYCDFGYYYDYYKQKCQKNNCYPEEGDNDKGGMSKTTKALIIIFSVIGFILIVVIIFFICRRKNKDTDSEKIESVDRERLVED